MDKERTRQDRRLADRIEAGDAAALEELYDTYSTAVYRQALSVVGCASDAEDVLQDVFLKLVRRRGGPVRDLKAYLLTAARHQATSVLRRRQREAPDENLEAVPCASHRDSGAFTDFQAVREALAALPADQREVVLLKVYDQLTFEEIGRVVRVSVNTVASRYRYALQKLRKALGDSADVR
jgi:RNA polymerase sigma-70 factor (ECF subfamily)